MHKSLQLHGHTLLTILIIILRPTSYILPDASRESGQKTRMVKRSISPKYNHTMVYDGFHTSDLKEACAELTVWQRDGLKRHILGGVRLSCGTGENLWTSSLFLFSITSLSCHCAVRRLTSTTLEKMGSEK